MVAPITIPMIMLTLSHRLSCARMMGAVAWEERSMALLIGERGLLRVPIWCMVYWRFGKMAKKRPKMMRKFMSLNQLATMFDCAIGSRDRSDAKKSEGLTATTISLS